MARMILMKIITIALAVYIICLSDFFLPPEGDIVNVLMVACIDPSLSYKVTNLSSLLGFMNITSTIPNCSENGTQRRMTEIKVFLNHSSNERNQENSMCQNVTPHFIATGRFICKTDTKEKHTLNQESSSQVFKMMISITDRSVITGVSGLRMHMFPIPNRINATWSYSSANGIKTIQCYMEVQFQNSTRENLTDQHSDLCTKKNCTQIVTKGIANDPCYKNTTNYLIIAIKDMNTNIAEPSPEGIYVAWNIHSPYGMQTTKCFTHVQLQHSTIENQEQNCVLEIIWLALFPTICVTLLIIISYQWFKEDSSSKALNCRSSSDSPQEITEEFGYANVRISGSRQQEAPVYLNEIQQEGSRRQLSDHVTCSRENQHTEAIVHFQARNNIRDGSNRHINRHSHKTTYSATESPKTGLNKGDRNSSKKHTELSVILVHGNTPSNNEGAHIIPPPNSPKQQNSGSVTIDEYANIHPEMKEDSLKHHHPSGENSRQEETPVYFNKIQKEGGRMQSSGCVAWPREIQHTEPIIHNQGMRDSVRLYGNIQQPNSEGAPAHEYANFLDLAEYEGFLTDCNLSAVPSLCSLPEQTRNVAVAVGSENHLLLTSDTPDLHHYHSQGDNNATHKEKRKILCL